MDLVEMLSTVWRTKWIILITALVAAGLVLYQTITKETTYRADSTLVVGSMSPGTSTLGRAGGEDKLAISYAELIHTRVVLEKAREIGGLDISNGKLSSHLGSVAPPKDNPSPFVKLYSEAGTPEDAVGEVNAVSQALVQYVSEMQAKVLRDNRDTVLAELTTVEQEIMTLQEAPVKDQSRISALEDIRKTLIGQYADVMTGNLPGANLRVVGEAQYAIPSVSHPFRNTGLAFLAGALAGVAIGFAIDSVRKAWRRDAPEAEVQL